MRGRFNDITGQRFGHWTVLGFMGFDENRRARWLCRCDCGTERVHHSSNFVSGHSKSCGCANWENRERIEDRDLTGQRFGHWTVLECVWKGSRDTKWLCRCDCGTESVKSYCALKGYNEESSCGCTRMNPNKVNKRRRGKRYNCCGVD